MDRLRGVVSRTNNVSDTREVTAAQLTGVAANVSTSNTTTNANSGSRTGRRRNRRRTSQRSTTSLPAYMKEPGDMELVIFRGPEEMDASNMIAEAREAEDAEDMEDLERTGGEEGRDQMRENTTGGLLHPRVSMLNPDASMQSLDAPSANGEEADTSTTQLIANNGHNRADSGDTAASASSTSILERPATLYRLSEVPSEAPPGYDSNSDQRHSSANMDPPGLSNTSPSSTEHSAQIRPRTQTPNTMHSRISSRISRILHFRSGSDVSNETTAANSPSSISSHEPETGAIPAHQEFTHAPVSSNEAATGEMPIHNNLTSVLSLNEPPPASSGPVSRPPVSLYQHARHRASHSGGSSSTLNLALPFRTISRQRSTTSLALGRQTSRSTQNLNQTAGASSSNANLTSPSTLSLSLASGANPISPPLSHTVVRTEIRYPAGGPTPDQIKLLSSREGFGRFALPYGEDAIAHARRSRVELLDDPPPQFESPTTEVGRSAAREAREAHETRSRPSEDSMPRGSMSEDGPDPDAIPEELLAWDREQDTVHAAIMDSRVFVPMFM